MNSTRKPGFWTHRELDTAMLALQSILLFSVVNVTFISLRNSMHSSRSEKPNSGTKNSTGNVGRYLFDMIGCSQVDERSSNIQ